MSDKKSIGFCIACGILVAGCAQNLERTDTINSFAGDSVARNVAIHTIDPSPYRSRRRHLHFNGKRLSEAQEFYEKPSKAPADKVQGSGISNL